MAAINQRSNFKVNWYNPSLERLRNQTDKIVRQNIQRHKQQTSMMSLLDPFFNIKAQKRMGASNWFEGVFKGLYGKNGVFDNFLGEWFRNPGQALVNDLQIIGNTLDYGANLIKAPLIAGIKGESVSTRLKDAYGLGDRGRVEQNMAEFRKALGCPASGTISGVLAGTMIGTQIAPGWGTLIGAAVGVTVGGVSDILRANGAKIGDTITDMAMEYSADPGNIAGTIAAPIKAVGTAKKAADVAETAQETLEQTAKHIDDMNNVVKTNNETLNDLYKQIDPEKESVKNLKETLDTNRKKIYDDFDKQSAAIKTRYKTKDKELDNQWSKYLEDYKIKSESPNLNTNEADALLKEKEAFDKQIKEAKAEIIKNRDISNKKNINKLNKRIDELDNSDISKQYNNAVNKLADTHAQIKTAKDNIANAEKSTREFFEQSKQRIIDYAQGKSVNISAEDAHDWLIQGTAEFSIDQASKFKSTANIAARRQKFFDNYRKRIYNAIYDGDKKEFSKLFMQAGLHKLDEGTSLTVKQMDNMFNVLVKDMNASKAYKVFHWFDSFDQSLAKGLFKITPMGMAAKAVKKGIALNKNLIRSKVLADTYSKLSTELFDAKKANKEIAEINKRISDANASVDKGIKAKFKKASKTYQAAKEQYYKDYDTFMENVKKHNPTAYDEFKAQFKNEYGFDYIPKKEITSENRGEYVRQIREAINNREKKLDEYIKTLDPDKPYTDDIITSLEEQYNKINQLKGTYNSINFGDENHFISIKSFKSKTKNVIKKYYKNYNQATNNTEVIKNVLNGKPSGIEDEAINAFLKDDIFISWADDVHRLLRDPENYEILDRVIFELQYIATKDGYEFNDYVDVILGALFEQSKKSINETADETYKAYLKELTDKISKARQSYEDSEKDLNKLVSDTVKNSKILAMAKLENLTEEAAKDFRKKYFLFALRLNNRDYTHEDITTFLKMLEPEPIDPGEAYEGTNTLESILELYDSYSNLNNIQNQLDYAYKSVKHNYNDKYMRLKSYETLLEDGRDAVRKNAERQTQNTINVRSDAYIQELQNADDKVIASINIILRDAINNASVINDSNAVYRVAKNIGFNIFGNNIGTTDNPKTWIDLISDTDVSPFDSVFAKIYKSNNWLAPLAEACSPSEKGFVAYVNDALNSLAHQQATIKKWAKDYGDEFLNNYINTIHTAITRLKNSNLDKKLSDIFKTMPELIHGEGAVSLIKNNIKLYALTKNPKYISAITTKLKELKIKDSVIEKIVNEAENTWNIIAVSEDSNIYKNIIEFIYDATDNNFIKKLDARNALYEKYDLLKNLEQIEKRLNNIKDNKLQQSVIVDEACARSLRSAKYRVERMRESYDKLNRSAGTHVYELPDDYKGAEMLISQLDTTREAYSKLNTKIEEYYTRRLNEPDFIGQLISETIYNKNAQLKEVRNNIVSLNKQYSELKRIEEVYQYGYKRNIKWRDEHYTFINAKKLNPEDKKTTADLETTGDFDLVPRYYLKDKYRDNEAKLLQKVNQNIEHWSNKLQDNRNELTKVESQLNKQRQKLSELVDRYNYKYTYFDEYVNNFTKAYETYDKHYALLNDIAYISRSNNIKNNDNFKNIINNLGKIEDYVNEQAKANNLTKEQVFKLRQVMMSGLADEVRINIAKNLDIKYIVSEAKKMSNFISDPDYYKVRSLFKRLAQVKASLHLLDIFKINLGLSGLSEYNGDIANSALRYIEDYANDVYKTLFDVTNSQGAIKLFHSKRVLDELLEIDISKKFSQLSEETFEYDENGLIKSIPEGVIKKLSTQLTKKDELENLLYAATGVYINKPFESAVVDKILSTMNGAELSEALYGKDLKRLAFADAIFTDKNLHPRDGYKLDDTVLDMIASDKKVYAVTTMDANGNIIKDDPELIKVLKKQKLSNAAEADIETTITNDDNKDILQTAIKSKGKKISYFVYDPEYTAGSKSETLLDKSYVDGSMLQDKKILDNLASNNANSFAKQSDGSLLFKDIDSMALHLVDDFEKNGNIITLENGKKYIMLIGHNNNRFDDEYLLKALKKVDPNIDGIIGVDNFSIAKKLKAFGIYLKKNGEDFSSLDNTGKLAYVLADLRSLKQEDIYNALVETGMIKAVEGLAHNASTDIEYTEAIFNLLKQNNIETPDDLDKYIKNSYNQYKKLNTEFDPVLDKLVKDKRFTADLPEIKNAEKDIIAEHIRLADEFSNTVYGKELSDEFEFLKTSLTNLGEARIALAKMLRFKGTDTTSIKFIKAYQIYVDALEDYAAAVDNTVKNDTRKYFTEDMFAIKGTKQYKEMQKPEKDVFEYFELNEKGVYKSKKIFRKPEEMVEREVTVLDEISYTPADAYQNARVSLEHLKDIRNSMLYGVYGDSVVYENINKHKINHIMLERFFNYISGTTDNTFNIIRGIYSGVLNKSNVSSGDLVNMLLEYTTNEYKDLDFAVFNRLDKFYKHIDRVKKHYDFYNKLVNYYTKRISNDQIVDPEVRKAFSTILDSLFSDAKNVRSVNSYLGKYYSDNRKTYSSFKDFLQEMKHNYRKMFALDKNQNFTESVRILVGDDNYVKVMNEIDDYILDCMKHSDEVIYDFNHYNLINPQLNRTSLNTYNRAISNIFDRFDSAYNMNKPVRKSQGLDVVPASPVDNARKDFKMHMADLRQVLSVKKEMNTGTDGLCFPEGYLSEMYDDSLFDINSSMSHTTFKRAPKTEDHLGAMNIIQSYRDLIGVKFDIYNDSPAITYRNTISIAEHYILDILDEKNGTHLLPSDITDIFNELDIIKKPYKKSLIEALALNYDELNNKLIDDKHFKLYKNFVENVAESNINYSQAGIKEMQNISNTEATEEVMLLKKQAKAIAVMMYYMDEYDDDIYMTLKRGELRQSYEATKKFLNKEYSNTLEPPVKPKWKDFEPYIAEYLDYKDIPDIKNMVDYTSNTLLINNQHWLSTFSYKDDMYNNKVDYEAMYRYLQSNDDLELIVMHKSKKYRQGGASTYLKDLKSNNKYDRTAGEINIINAKSAEDLENLFNLNRDDIIVSILDKNTIQKYRKTIGHLGRNRVYKSNTLNKLVVLRDAIMHYICLPIKLMGLENIGFTVTNALEGMTKTLIGTSGDRASTMKQYRRATTMHKNWQNTMLEFEQMSGVRTARGVLMASPLYKRVKDPRKLIEYDTIFGNAVKNLGEDFANDDAFKTLPKYIQSIYKNSMELHKTKPEKYDYSFAEYIEGIKTRVDQINKATTDKKSKMYQILNDDSFYDEFNYVNRFINSPAASAEYQSLMRADDMGAIENSTKSKGIDKLYNRVFFTEWAPVISPAFNMGLNSDIETINRLALDLDLFEKGFTESETLNRVLKTHFNYSNKSQLELTADMMFPFISFPLRTFMFWADALEEHPALIKVFADLMLCNWKGQENNPYNQGKISKGGIWLWGDVAMESGLSVYSSMSFIGNPIDALYNKKLNPLAGYAIEGIKSLALGKKSEKYDYRLGRLPGVSHTKAGINLANSLAKGEVHPYTVAPSLFNRVYQNNGYYYRNQGRYVYKNIYNNIFYAHGKQRSVNNQIKRGWK